jgi:hypothetical protein
MGVIISHLASGGNNVGSVMPEPIVFKAVEVGATEGFGVSTNVVLAIGTSVGFTYEFIVYPFFA